MKKSSSATWIYYGVLIIVGPLILLVSALLSNLPPSPNPEYYYSSLLTKNYSSVLLPPIIFFIIGLLAGFFLKLNPWLVGFCLFFIFPVTALIEASIYHGSHNLIPFELIMHFIYALPVVLATYLGKLIVKRITKKRENSGLTG